MFAAPSPYITHHEKSPQTRVFGDRMTSDQVQLDEATANGAVASLAEDQPKPVRRRITKKADFPEQPTLPETVPDVGAAPEKPKRTRTRVAKSKAEESSEVAAESAPASTPVAEADVSLAPQTKPSRTRRESSAPVVEPFAVVENGSSGSQGASPTTEKGFVPEQSELPAIESRPAPVENEFVAPEDRVATAEESVLNNGDDTASRPSIPARFPSRFKRIEEPRADDDAPSVQAAPVVEQPSAPMNAQAMGNTETPVEAREQNRDTRDVENPTDGANPENGADGEGATQNGELPEGGFGRMRYRERREFRRQQRLQGRQDRIGPNGEVIPFQEPRPQDGRTQPQEPRPQPNGNGQNGFNRGQNGLNQPYERQPQQRRREYDFFSLRAMGDEDLENAAREYGLEPDDSRGRDALVMALMEAQARAQNSVLKTGILDAHDHNKAFLRCEGYTPSEADVYVSQTQIKRFNLKTGDLVFGTARAPKENERFFGLLRVESINGLSPDELRTRKDFEKLTPIFPDERYNLETDQSNITARIIDLVSPVGKGQRGLIVAPPKAGKTTLIKSIANSIALNNPEAELFVLLIDERPEEVTDISRSVRGTVVASTFDEMPDNHMRVADIVLERAKRLVEMKQDVVILLDSITRLSRASNLVVAPSGRTLSGGLDPAAMYRPKRMFGAARNIEEGGSLTMLATALVDTGSRMDEMIFEEFKGTGNMDLVLDRDLFNQRIFPAIDINKSGTRRDDLLLSKDELAATFHLRQTLARLDNDQAVKLLIDRLKNTKSNANFMEVVSKSARQAEVKGA